MEIKSTLDLAKEQSKKYPLSSIEMVAAFLYGSSHIDNVQQVEQLIKDHKLLSITPITTSNNQVVSIPLFQLKLYSDVDVRSGVTIAPIIEKLGPTLSKIDRDGAYVWLTSHNNDLGCPPCDAIHKPELHEMLQMVTGLFVSESTLSHLTYVADNHQE